MLGPLLIGSAIVLLALRAKSKNAAAPAPEAGLEPVAVGEKALFTGDVAPRLGENQYLVRAGDYPAKIARGFTGDAARWPELVAQNPDKPRAASGSFATLFPGEVLIVPAAWVRVGGGGEAPKPAEPTTEIKPTPGPDAPKTDPKPAPTGDMTASDGSIVGLLSTEELRAFKTLLLEWWSDQHLPSFGEKSYSGLDVGSDSWTNRDMYALSGFQNWANDAAKSGKLPTDASGTMVSLRTDGVLDTPTSSALLIYDYNRPTAI